MKVFGFTKMLAAAVVCFASAALAGDYPILSHDPTQADGVWQLVEGVNDGVIMSAEDVQLKKLIIEGNTFTLPASGENSVETRGTFTIDTNVVPNTIDAVHTEGEHAGQTLLGIIKLDGDLKTIAFAAPGSERPTEFASAAGSGVMLSVWRKVPE